MLLNLRGIRLANRLCLDSHQAYQIGSVGFNACLAHQHKPTYSYPGKEACAVSMRQTPQEGQVAQLL